MQLLRMSLLQIDMPLFKAVFAFIHRHFGSRVYHPFLTPILLLRKPEIRELSSPQPLDLIHPPRRPLIRYLVTR